MLYLNYSLVFPKKKVRKEIQKTLWFFLPIVYHREVPSGEKGGCLILFRIHNVLKKYCSLLLLVSVLAVWHADSLSAYALPVITDADTRTAIPIESNSIPNWPQGPVISAQSAILIDADTGAVLYSKNAHEKLYPASTTKILTCLIATERCSLTDTVTFSHDAVFDTPRDSSNIAMDVGYELTLEQCLQAILIASANEASYAVAEHISGTTDWSVFADIMNERAKELGCVDSHFANPNGLPDENHYTSSYDLARIGMAFFANDLLCKISSTPQLDLEPTDKQPKHVVENSKNQLFAGRNYAYEYLVGSKTGYTVAARSTLVSCAEKDGLKLIAVVMVEDSPAQFADTVTLFQYGFENFEKVNISQKETRYQMENGNAFYGGSDIFGSSKPILSLDTEDTVILPKTVPFEDLTSEISYDTDSPEQAALITYTYRDQFLGSVAVNFTTGTEKGYDFTAAVEPEHSTSLPKVIFINVVKVILWIVGIAGGLILLLILYAFIRNYHFELRKRGGRKGWLKTRKRKISRYQKSRIAAAKKNIRQQKKRQRKEKKRSWEDDE